MQGKWTHDPENIAMFIILSYHPLEMTELKWKLQNWIMMKNTLKPGLYVIRVLFEPAHEIIVLITQATREGSGEPLHQASLRIHAV